MTASFAAVAIVLALAGLAEAETANTVASVDQPRASVDKPRAEGWLETVEARPAAGVVKGSLTYEQGQAYYRLLDHSDRVADAALCAAAADELAFAKKASPRFQLFPALLDRPERWQGRPVRLSGHVNRVAAIPAPENDYGLTTLYELWLVSPDSQRYPTVIICSELPPGMPVGEQLLDGVSACGYFFKLHAYPARDGKGRLAPMVIAGAVDWTPPQPVPPLLSPAGTRAVAAALTLLFGIGLWAISRKRPPRSRRSRDAVEFAPPAEPETTAEPLDPLDWLDADDDRDPSA